MASRPGPGVDGGSPRAVVSGASGLIGSALVDFLASRGYRVARLVRRPAAGGGAEIAWDPARGIVDSDALEGADAVIHLAGKNIAGRWNAAVKREILESRTAGTRLLASALAALRRPPRVLVSASAIGYYGDRGDRTVTEDSPPGAGFLPDVAKAWEAAAQPAVEAGIRVVHPRIGIVLSARGGALAQMLMPFRLGLGGVIGSGRQHMSWIALDDVVAALEHLAFGSALSGAVNVVAPHPVTNREFAATLGRVLGRPTMVPLPAFMVRLVFGEMGQALLLEGARVLPTRLEASGFRFRYPRLEEALRAELARRG